MCAITMEGRSTINNRAVNNEGYKVKNQEIVHTTLHLSLFNCFLSQPRAAPAQPCRARH